ncbi:hypothetical protein MTO98_07035 [Mucilaginibacter sp. SMC90]|uniref:hypothetical protein n=1 Tax=Mucilaginibacter sp. SMC90 TaxID=2929803 RepID=UPI001FB2E4F5|nr:hypothetical protein [Mucilaginibacter sp. SMC90]UOE50829.1 hypothetical protein MTO98_07035 [Mucilaginibacter sp. SMC90]
MCFEFNDGKKIDLSDYLATGKFIREKNEQLKQFLTMAERELGFSAISINKTRKFGKIGSTWFAKAVILILLPALGFAQGVPKAYEAFSYKGILNGHSVQLSLADGYIGASYIISKNIKFQPESNSPDEQHHLKFITNKNNSYFILNNMQEAYGNRPGTITGKYYINNKAVTIKLNARKLFKNAKYSLSVVSTNIGLNPSYRYINSNEDFFYVETHNCVSLRTSLLAGYFATVNCMRETQLCVSTFKNNRFYSFSEVV